MTDVHDYVTWGDIIGLEDSKRYDYSMFILWLEHGGLIDDIYNFRVG